MSVTTVNSGAMHVAEPIQADGLWLRNKNWDTLFMTMSVLLVPLPYLFYLLGLQLGFKDEVARNAVNIVIALLVGGPHMYATFMRTALDEKFVKRYPMLIRTSIIIPIIVVSLAFLNLTLLLTVFFFWASIHVLHQVTYVVELYNHRQGKLAQGKSAVTMWSRAVDYALILTCLFPIASLKISQHNFQIGTNDLTKVIPSFFFAENGEASWFFILMTSLFTIAVIAFIIKTYREWKGGYINWPKTVFIVITVAVACTMPALNNLDTAFQGLNTWHSFQYLALTFYIIKLREQNGDLQPSAKVISRAVKGQNSLRLYMFSASMVGGSALLGIVVWITVGIVDPTRESLARFDTAYYTAILCFLWIHYYHDHFLFTDFEAVDREAFATPVASRSS
jgi:hypothetical protein